MKKNISLSIPKPCAQQWNTFKPTSLGGYCSSCNKTVIDFTKMGDDELVDFFKSNASHTCGRFRNDQLKRYHYNAMVKVSPGFPLLKAGVASLLVLLMTRPMTAQTLSAKNTTEVSQQHSATETTLVATESEYLIKGVVLDEENTPIPGVSVHLKGTTVGTVTGFEGKFEFPQKLRQGDVLIFSFIGYETKEYKVPPNPEAIIEIRFTLDMCVLMGEVAVEGVYEESPTGFRKLVAKVKGLF